HGDVKGVSISDPGSIPGASTPKKRIGMLHPIEKSIFILIVLLSIFYSWRNFQHLFRMITTGGEKLASGFHFGKVLQSIWLFASQTSLFKSRPIATILHIFVAWGFTLYMLVNVIDVWRAWLVQTPEYSSLGIAYAYRLFTDIFSILILIAIVYFLFRRFILKSEKLIIRDDILMGENNRKQVRQDSAIVAIFIFLHVGLRFLGSSFEMALHELDSAQIFASGLAGCWESWSPERLNLLAHISWWMAIGLLLVFIPYFPFTKHAHLFMAPVNHYFNDESKRAAVLTPIDMEDEDLEQYGAAILTDLPQKSRLDAYACIMCNRCQDGCPAYNSGKPLSPSALEVNKRLNMNIQAKAQDKKSEAEPLRQWLITDEGTWACTTCGYCETICPVGNEPFRDLLSIRQDLVLMESEFPQEAITTFKNLENNGNPWGISRQDRLKWAENLDIPQFKTKKKAKYLYWVGCAGAYDDKAIQTSKAMVKIMQQADIDFAVLGTEENCSGDTARRLGNEYLFQMSAMENIETFEKYEFEVIVTQCPHCFTTLKNDYPAMGGEYKVISHAEFISELINDGKLNPEKTTDLNFSYHDSCYLGRHNDIYDEPRNILTKLGGQYSELSRNKESAFCCGAGGGRMWLEESIGEKINIQRTEEIKENGADILATACPFCNTMLTDGCKEKELKTEVKDIAVLTAERL
ncbi:4Fe-4S dicluster domain-containing protein, partial [bacterium]|nr:4Fe-4S dicluster domain-containing protein [bacterium]